MSPTMMLRFPRRIVPLVALFVLTLLLLPAVHADWDNEPGPALQSRLDEIQAQTAEIRGLEILEPIDVYFMGEEEREQFYTGSEPGISMRSFYAAFDFIPLDFDLAEVSRLLDAQTESGGYYMHGSNRVTIMLYTQPTLGNDLPLRERITYVHELTHALQDQHFDLQQVQSTYFIDEDQRMGVLGLIEGDAVLTEQLFADQLAETDPQAKLVMSYDLLGFGEYSDAIPDIYREITYNTYLDGMNFVKHLYNLGGWERVNAAYDDPPRSSEHILHPERYLAGDTPVSVSLMPLYGEWEADWEMVWGETFGEFYLRQYLRTQLDTVTANRAAEGWGGDRYLLYRERDTDQQAWVMRHVWDTVEDADEFADAFAQLAASRMATTHFALDDTTDCWKSAAGDVMCLRSEGVDGTLATFAPDLAMARAFLNEQE